MRSFKSILVANRGEIAGRIMRTAQALGYKTIAIYSEADANAPHVHMADDAVLIGPPPVGQSYLDIGRVLDAAQEAGAQAIHPGYGFLSENADFARACETAGLVFIGPTPESIDLMGNKAAAKRHMLGANVPCVPGYEGADQSDEVLVSAANDIGFPIMVKAAAGGGGRGMRLVHTAKDLPDALNSARSEALNAFGSDELILENAILRPRHVEVQVFADTHGNVIHLGERDCSVQRRHQKVVEEAPCPVMTDDLRARMGATAVEAARSINYRGAGTVEFLLDADEQFYFLEMNTRLQVEHPVTEMITGLDLVGLQIQVAEGHPLGLTQDDIKLFGHAIEVRLYAEDTAQGFLPCTGTVDLWQPAEGEGVRFDSGIETGQEISSFYDPMIAKAIAWGETREVARHRLVEALKDTVLFGLTTNRGFLIDVLEKDTFAKGEATTAFIADEFDADDLADAVPDPRQAAMAAVLHYQTERQSAFDKSVNVSPTLMNWSSGGQLLSRYVYAWDDNEIDLTVTPESDRGYRVETDEASLSIELLKLGENTARLSVDGRRHTVHFAVPTPGHIYLSVEGKTASFRNRIAFARSAEAAAGGGRVAAPMHGILLDICVKPGDRVKVGTRLAVLEAMKMQHDIMAEIDGTVREVHAQSDQQVAAADLLIEIDATEPGDAISSKNTGMQQAIDFGDESDALYKLLAPLTEEDFNKSTLFKDWSANDILAHLHYFNYLADLSLNDEERFLREYGEMRAARDAGETMVEATDRLLGGVKGHALLTLWHDYYPKMTERFAAADPKKRLKWAGPDMSVRSSITARLMETWAHGQAIYDLLGVNRVNQDRIKNIVIIGINTFGWTFINRGEEVPTDIPYVRLKAPSGEIWEWNEPSADNFIEGLAEEFCQVVTQTRNIADTNLNVAGDTAIRWMAVAQCFAGPARTPPAPGVRRQTV